MKIVAPAHNPGALYFNKRLLNSLPVLLERPLTVVEAPMGYGKTVAVQEFLHAGLPPGSRMIWTTALDHNENAFWRDFCRAFKAAFPEENEVAQALEGLGYPYDSIRVDAAWELIRRVDFPSQTIIIVDDYHMLSTQGLGRLCELLARSGHANLHVVLITRNEYVGNKELLQLKGLMGHVGRDAFALSRDEIIAYYACCGVKLPSEDAETLFAHTSGWISALYLYLLRYIKQGVLEEPEALTALVEEEVFAPLSSATRNFLFALYPAERFSLEQAVFLDVGEYTEELLQELQQKNSFVYYDAGSRTFALHSILRSFLKERFQRLPVSQQRAFHRRCGDWHLSQGKTSAAMAAYYAAGDYEKSLQVLESDMDNQMMAENAHLLVRFFKICPEEILERHVGAGFKYAMAAFMAEDKQAFSRRLNWLAQKCASMPENDPETATWRGELHVLYGLAAYNNLAVMREHFREALELLNGPTSLYGTGSHWSFGSPSVLFMFYRHSGKLLEDLSLLQETLPRYYALTKHHGAGCDLVMEAEILYLRGNFEAAEIFCHKAAREALKHKQLGVIACTIFLRMRLALVRGDLPAARELLLEARRLVVREQDNQMLHNLDMCKALLFTSLGRLDEVPNWLKREDSREGRLYVAAGGYYHIMAGRMMLLNGEYAKVIGVFDSLLEDETYSGHCLFEIYACVYIAAAYRMLGNESAARAALRQALKVALPDQLYMPFAMNSDFLEPLLKVEARAQGVGSPEMFARISELYDVWSKSIHNIVRDYLSELDGPDEGGVCCTALSKSTA